MILRVFDPASTLAKTGFTNHQFRRLDALYLRGVAEKVLSDRSVECDFDEGIASYTYYAQDGGRPLLQFLIIKAGPRSMLYEVYKSGKGRIAKSGLFDRAFEMLSDEIEALF